MLDAGAVTTRGWVADEARALLARVSRVRPLIVQETMTPAASPHRRTQRAIELAIRRDQLRLQAELRRLLQWLTSPAAGQASGAELQDRLTHARLQFNDALSNFDLFADAITQRSERDTGIWLAGLDVAAEDVLAMPHYETPPVLCFLDRGPGAAIRRARTRLPGGGRNPIALIQIPRERMTGGGVAASLAHETGHQAAALLELVESLRRELRACGERAGDPRWAFWERWISEIVADLWAVAKLGPSATMGLVGILALPPYFVFRISGGDPHPPPWLRVKLSAAFGRVLYPDAQWDELAALWDALYPFELAAPAVRATLASLATMLDTVARTVLEHRCHALAPEQLGDAIAIADRAPAQLRRTVAARGWIGQLGKLRPAHALAIVGQARWSRSISPETERRVVANLLGTWAVRRAVGSSTDSTH
ncbi:MAG TPA: hypothetical protein VFQ53_26385 [Kofleriaceae bacterium]|nr:hypothetical protein [Kofleriaceae bacterium]